MHCRRRRSLSQHAQRPWHRSARAQDVCCTECARAAAKQSTATTGTRTLAGKMGEARANSGTAAGRAVPSLPRAALCLVWVCGCVCRGSAAPPAQGAATCAHAVLTEATLSSDLTAALSH